MISEGELRTVKEIKRKKMDYSASTIEIPLKDSDEVIELGLDQLPDGEEVLSILIQENCPLHVWIRLAIGYYRQGKINDFVHILEQSRTSANTNYKGHEKDMLKALDTLAAHYVQQANKEKNKELKKEYCSKATTLYTSADKISMYDSDHLLSRAYFCLLDTDKLDQADAQFNFVLTTNSNNVAALVGKACTAFNKKDYKNALNYYKRALKANPNAPASVRLGMGMCFYKMTKVPKAKLAFERALELDSQCVGALIGLAIIELNNKTPESVKHGVEMLSKAYAIDSTNPIVLNHLANHFFYKKDYQKVQQLAMHAFHNTENESIRAETCYQLARSYHAQGDLDQAFQYYYQATQFNANFILPFFGLGQMYLYKNDKENAAICLEKVLKANPGNYESMKILASIYSKSKEQEKRDLAKQYFKKVTELCPDDVEAWIELAELLEVNDIQGALSAYGIATKILKEKVQEDIPPEILNNLASLHFRLGNYDECRKYYEAAFEIVNEECGNDKIYYGAIGVTIQYNLARLQEAKHEYDLAEKSYRSIIQKHPQYIDCFLRLGCMCRDRGQIHEASEWFKEALRINQSHPDIWSLIGNLHLNKEQLGPAQHVFDRIIKINEQDTYALVALGNIWLHTLYQPIKDKEKVKRHEQRAIQMYRAVLKIDARNIWAANGVGCVMAHKNLLNEARDIFAQVREATADFSDVWLNIAHILVEQRQYIRAIQMYENCSKKFFKHTNTELLNYLIRALYKANKLVECKQVLMKARHISPEDIILMYNLALVQQKLSKQVMSDNKSSLRSVETAIYDLDSASRTFQWLNTSGEGDRLRGEFRCDFKLENKICQDLLTQSSYHLARAKRLDEEEKELKRKQEQEIQQLKQKQLQEQLLREQELEKQKQELAEKRAEFVKKTTQNLTRNIEIEEKPEKKSKKRSKKDTVDIVSSGSESSEATQDEERSEAKSKTESISKSETKSKSKKKKRKTQIELSDDEMIERDEPSEREQTQDEEEVENDDEKTERDANFIEDSNSQERIVEKSHKSKSKKGKTSRAKILSDDEDDDVGNVQDEEEYAKNDEDDEEDEYVERSPSKKKHKKEKKSKKEKKRSKSSKSSKSKSSKSSSRSSPSKKHSSPSKNSNYKSKEYISSSDDLDDSDENRTRTEQERTENDADDHDDTHNEEEEEEVEQHEDEEMPSNNSEDDE